MLGSWGRIPGLVGGVSCRSWTRLLSGSDSLLDVTLGGRLGSLSFTCLQGLDNVFGGPEVLSTRSVQPYFSLDFGLPRGHGNPSVPHGILVKSGVTMVTDVAEVATPCATRVAMGAVDSEMGFPTPIALNGFTLGGVGLRGGEDWKDAFVAGLGCGFSLLTSSESLLEVVENRVLVVHTVLDYLGDHA